MNEGVKIIFKSGKYRRLSHADANILITKLENEPKITTEKETRHCITNIVKKNDRYTVVYEFSVRRGGKAAKNWNYYTGFLSYDKACEFAQELAFGDTHKKTIKKGGKTLGVELHNEDCDIMLLSSKYRDQQLYAH